MPTILELVDGAYYQALYNSILAYKPVDIQTRTPNVEAILRPNQFNPENKWNNDFIRAWGQLTSTILREYERNRGKALFFPVSQLILCALNPTLGEGRIWNPLHTLFLLGAPFLAGNVSIYLDQLFMGGHSNVEIRREKTQSTRFHNYFNGKISAEGALNSLLQGNIPDIPEEGEIDRIKRRNIYTDDQKYPDVKFTNVPGESQYTPKESLTSKKTAEGTPTYYEPNKNLIEVNNDNVFRFKIQKMDTEATLTAREAMDNVDEVIENLAGEDHTYDLVLYDYKSGKTIVLPAALKSLGETLTPAWQLENFIGRVDPVPGYLNTPRTFNLALEFFAYSEREYIQMWKKLNWISSLVYPEFNQEGIRNKIPIMRVKLGDVINDYKNRGLLSIITGLTFDHKMTAWELDPVVGIGPRNVGINITITVFHETEQREIKDDNSGIKKIYIHTISTDNGMKGFRKLGQLPIVTTMAKDTSSGYIDKDNDDMEELADKPVTSKPSPTDPKDIQ